MIVFLFVLVFFSHDECDAFLSLSFDHDFIIILFSCPLSLLFLLFLLLSVTTIIINNIITTATTIIIIIIFILITCFLLHTARHDGRAELARFYTETTTIIYMYTYIYLRSLSRSVLFFTTTITTTTTTTIDAAIRKLFITRSSGHSETRVMRHIDRYSACIDGRRRECDVKSLMKKRAVFDCFFFFIFSLFSFLLLLSLLLLLLLYM